MVNHNNIFKKIGYILNELQDQYQFLSDNPDQLSELELELFLANANFLSEHIQIVKKLTSNPPVKELPEAVIKEEVLGRFSFQEEPTPAPYNQNTLKDTVDREDQSTLSTAPTFEFVLNERSPEETIDLQEVIEDNHREEQVDLDAQELENVEEYDNEVTYVQPAIDEVGPEPFLVYNEVQPEEQATEPSSFAEASNNFIAPEPEADVKPEQEPFVTPEQKPAVGPEQELFVTSELKPAVASEQESIFEPESEPVTKQYSEPINTPIPVETTKPSPVEARESLDLPNPAAASEYVAPTPKHPEPVVHYQQPAAVYVEDDLKSQEIPATIHTLVPDKVEEKIVQPSAAAPRPTLNDLLAASQNPNNYNQNNAAPAITDLKKAVNLNEKLLYIKDLFNGYNLAYSEAIDIINKLPDFNSAETFLKNNYAVKNNWQAKQSTVDKFYALLKQRFPEA
ncbi:MAG: hypothetical protein EOO85_07330 [Pedobacter sp.]|nr:MAG: hypothetical protein EOO85_07330 [Pedobacter sp.]